jgi:hypothetical protein
MTRKLYLVLAAALTALVTATAALAAPARPVPYVFAGHLLSTPGAGGTSVSISVEGGTRRALRKMLGANVNQSFAVGTQTEYLKLENGVPTVVALGDLAQGDVVRLTVRAPYDASLSQIEGTSAGVVRDLGPNPTRPDQPLYAFRGILTAPVGTSSVSVHVLGGDRRALRLLIGHDADQTFTYGSSTLFLLWQGRVPKVISPQDLKVGDRITVHVRAARGSTLEQIESTPATRVGEHEPATTTS